MREYEHFRPEVQATLRKYLNIRYYRTRPSVFKLTQLLSTNKITLVNTYILHTTNVHL